MLQYEVEIAGGRGPDVWDNHFVVEAENFEDALIRAKARLGPRTEWDFVRIEQKD